jgi:hypothetical protein
VQRNASLYAHIYLTQHGELPSNEIGSVPLFESAYLANGTVEGQKVTSKDFVYKRKRKCVNSLLDYIQNVN